MDKVKFEHKNKTDHFLREFHASVDDVVRIGSLVANKDNLKKIKEAVCQNLGASIKDIKKDISTIELIIGE